MAQIIRHKKGVLESVKDATFKRKAEILVSTGSSVSGLDSSVVFIGRDGSRLDAVGKIYTGSSTPDIANNSSLDDSIDGIPFYNTTSEKLFILKKSGNVEVKTTANTNGTGIISGSQQIAALGAGIVSSSAQTITHLLGTNVYSSSAQVAQDLTTDNRNINLGNGTFTTTNTGSFGHLSVTGNTTIDGNLTLGGNITIGDASSDNISFGGQVSSDIIPDPSNTYDLGSSTNKFAEIHGTTIYGSISATNGVVSGSTQTIAHLNGSGVISGSEQLLNEATDFGTGRVSGDNFGDVAGTSTFTGSFVGDGSGLTGLATNLIISSSDDGTNDSLDLLSDTLNFAGTSNEVDVTVDSATNTVQVGLVTNPTIGGNLTVAGNLEIQGTTTTVDSTTITLGDNILELNGSGVANGGLLVKDATSPNTISGSLLWDSTNDYWKAGALGSEERILLANGDGIVSQSLLNDLTDSEVNQLKNIDTTTISTTQWGYLGSSDQGIATTDNVTFANISGSALDLTGLLHTDGNATIGGTLGVTGLSSLGNISGSSIDLTGNVVADGNASVGGTLTVTGNTSLAGISGSSLDITGNAKIDGNLVLGGNITIGDASTDTIAFGGDLTTDIIPDVTNTVDLGSSTRVFAEAHATNFYGTTNGTVNATNGVISGSEQLLNEATDFGTGRVSGDNFGDVAGTSTFTGSFVGDGSGITGLSTTISISGSDGSNDQVSLLNGAVTFDGGTGVSTTVASDTVTISVQDASTSVKGIASFETDDFSVTAGAVSIKNGGVRAVNLNADVVGDGLELDGTNNDINVLYGSTANTAVAGNTTITVTGTTNEIEITGTSAQTLGGGASYTIGLPNDVTIGNDLTVSNDLSVSGNATITGNLSVLGTTTTIDSTTVQLGDNVLELNYGGAQDTAGLLVTDSTAPNVVSGSLLWDGTNDYWKGGALGSEKELARLNGSDNDTNFVQKLDGNGLLVDSVLSDDGTDATFSGDLTITGLSAGANGAFIYVDTNDKLQSVNASQAGDVIQWDGSSFVASNEIDGGAF